MEEAARLGAADPELERRPRRKGGEDIGGTMALAEGRVWACAERRQTFSSALRGRPGFVAAAVEVKPGPLELMVVLVESQILYICRTA